MRYQDRKSTFAIWSGANPPPNPRVGDVWFQQLPDEIILIYTVDGWRR